MAATWISSPVCGLRPLRAALITCSKEIQPGTDTLASPAATSAATTSKNASRHAPASLFDTPALSAIAPINPLLFIEYLLFWSPGGVAHLRSNDIRLPVGPNVKHFRPAFRLVAGIGACPIGADRITTGRRRVATRPPVAQPGSFTRCSAAPWKYSITAVAAASARPAPSRAAAMWRSQASRSGAPIRNGACLILRRGFPRSAL